MEDALYNKRVICPVCSKEFDVTKVKSKACKVVSRDSDFCVHYEGINPIFYDVWICEFCGYAAQAEKFEEIPSRDAEIILKNIAPRWNKRSFAGERTVDSALEAFKLALLNLQIRKAKSSEIARICLRIAWLYRINKDEREKDFLQFALKHYNDTYQRETFPVDKLDEYTCLYIIAELFRRVGNYDEAVKWFSRLVGSPEARKNASLIEAAREQFHLAKEQLENSASK